jgi:hypothetical protein
MTSFCKLSVSFDRTRLNDDLSQVYDSDWIPHYNTRDYKGDWAGAALRSICGATDNLYPDLTGKIPFFDAPLLGRCPYFREVLSHFQCPLRSVRLLRLRPGALVREHRDIKLSIDDGEARFHVPISSNPDVDFIVDGKKLPMLPGEAWYIDFTLPHRVANNGQSDRINLVIDCTPNDWLRELLSAAPQFDGPFEAVSTVARPHTKSDIERFCEIVLLDSTLQDELRKISNHQIFIEKVIRLGKAHGCKLSVGDVEEAMHNGMQASLEESRIR